MNLSIIIPVFNAEKFIKKCLDSICNQIKEKKTKKLNKKNLYFIIISYKYLNHQNLNYLN